MNFTFSEEQEMLRDSVRKFVERQYDIEVRRNVVTEHAGLNKAHWQIYAELGWLSVPFDEAYGGMSGSQQDTVVMMEEFGRGLIIEPYVATVLLFGRLIQQAGTEAQKESLLPQLISGELQGSVAYHEAQSRYELSDVLTRCEQDGDEFVLNGTKTVVFNGDKADSLVVSARTSGDQCDTQGISLFLVDGNNPGIEKKSLPLMDGQQVATIQFNNVRIPRENLLGELDKGFAALQQVTNQALLDLSSEAYGIMDMLLRKTTEYVKTREQFGTTIGKFQIIQHRLVDMYVACEEVKSLIFRALSTQDDPAALQASLSALKYKVEESGRQVWEDAIQFHGGMGMTDELDIGHYVKRLMMINATLGDGDHHMDLFIEQTQAA